MVKKIPIGVVHYVELQTSNYYVVDKTKMIQEFLERGSKVTLITRPRRFGKTSNMSMMSEFFDFQKKSNILFENTNIAKTEYRNEMNQYPVIFLSFANCKGNYEAMKKKIFETLRSEYAKYRPLFEKDEFDKDIVEQVRSNYKAICEAKELIKIDTSIKILSQFLYVVSNKRVMILIDEYDTPFIEAHINGCYEDIKGVLASLLHSALKDNEYLQYAMLTGIQRVAKENIFSDLNNLEVFTVKDREYADCFGFTIEETKALLEYYGVSYNNEVKAMYDGYNMGGIDIYNPWSIINYASKKELRPYWVNTSSNTMIKKAIQNSEQDFKTGFETLIKYDFLDTTVTMETSFYEDSSTGSLWGLFVNAGYLTVEKSLAFHQYRISIPNNEVRKEFASLTVAYLHVSNTTLMDMFVCLMDKQMDKMLDSYQRLILDLPSYHDLKDENSYHMMMLGMCACLYEYYDVLSNRESGKGRCDIVLKAKKSGNPSFIFEFKYTKDVKQLDILAKRAVEQILEQKYDTSLEGEIIYIGLAHCGKDVTMFWKSI